MESYTCSACDMSFKTKQELDDHNKKTHAEPVREEAGAAKEKR